MTQPDRRIAEVVSFWRSFRFAGQGIAHVARTQRNFRIHLIVAAFALALSGLVGLNWLEWAAIVTLIVVVLTVEMLNTVVEAIVDLVTQEFHPLAKVAKDVAAGAVFVAAIGASVVGLLVIGPHLLARLGWL